MCAVIYLLGGAFGEYLAGSLFVFYRPQICAQVRSESRMVASTYKHLFFLLIINDYVFISKIKSGLYKSYKHFFLHTSAWLSWFCQPKVQWPTYDRRPSRLTKSLTAHISKGVNVEPDFVIYFLCDFPIILSFMWTETPSLVFFWAIRCSTTWYHNL